MYITRQAPWHTGWDNMQNMLVKCRQTLCIIQTLAQSVPADECIQKSAVPCNKHSRTRTARGLGAPHNAVPCTHARNALYIAQPLRAASLGLLVARVDGRRLSVLDGQQDILQADPGRREGRLRNRTRLCQQAPDPASSWCQPWLDTPLGQ